MDNKAGECCRQKGDSDKEVHVSVCFALGRRVAVMTNEPRKAIDNVVVASEADSVDRWVERCVQQVELQSNKPHPIASSTTEKRRHTRYTWDKSKFTRAEFQTKHRVVLLAMN